MTPGSDAFLSLVSTRRSIRQFTDEPVPDETVSRILAVACRAPSAHNRQPWRFAVVRSEKARRGLAQAMAARHRSDLESDGLQREEIETQLERRRERLEEAPVVIVLCLTMVDMDAYPEARRQAAERTLAIQSLALAGGHLLLAAHAEGLGACWICAPLFAPEVVREVLDLPADWDPQAAILLGHPAEAGRETQRRAADEVTLWR
jgi:coenzyme F420-0:L-glutamate ligase/coenzyme F420-1:gamma-L-glutamate ligase